jgi:GNAT superfamily N-acetyltransferase
LTVREATRSDYGAIARLMRFTHSLPATEETMVEAEKRRKPSFLKRYVAENDGHILAYSKCERWPVDSLVRFILTVAVEPEFRGRGLGAELYRLSEEAGLKEGAQQLWAQTVENDAVSEGFAERRGFERNFFLQDLSIDLAKFDGTPFRNIVCEAEASGIRFARFSDYEDTEANRRRLYELHATVERDVPVFGEEAFPSFEDWQRRVIGSPWHEPAGQILAVDGDQWIGVGAVGKLGPDIYLNMITGVTREYRGRKIGLALKLLGIEFAKSRGAAEIHTQNHKTNATMLAINSKLGYQPLPGWNFWQRVVKQP